MSDFFPQRPTATSKIYAFASTHQKHAGLLRVGYTERNTATRIAEQFPSVLMTDKTALIESMIRLMEGGG